MRVFSYLRSTGYEMVHCIDERWETLIKLNTKPVGKKWKPLRVRRVRASKLEGFRPSDSPYLSGCGLIFRRSAVDALRELLDAHGELLPLEDEEGIELWAYHPRSLDAFDHERTVGSRDKDGKIENALLHVFIPSVVEGADIFKQACPRAGAIYLSERFLERWKQAKLKGLDFYLAWDSELPPEQQPNKRTSKPVKL